jgi:AraC-like DNA-binding protein
MNGTLSEFLNLLEVRGQTWCFLDIRSTAGFSMPAGDAVLFYAVVEGLVQITGVTGGTIELGPGNVAIVLSGEAHAVRTDANNPVHSLDFLSDEQIVDAPPTIAIGEGPSAARVIGANLRVGWPTGFHRAAMPPVVFMYSRHSAVRAVMMPIVGTGPGSAAVLTRLATLLLTVSLRNHPQCSLLFSASYWSDPISHAMYIMASDPCADWSIEKLACKVGMSRSSFSARFTAQIGRTAMEVITELRMQHAGALLQQGLKIAEIGERVGYRSEAAFSRRFKLHFGMSPTDMRRNVRTHTEPDPHIIPLPRDYPRDQKAVGM